MKRLPPVLGIISLAGLSLFGAEPANRIRKFELPPETGTYRPGAGLPLAQALCLNCHSTEYTEMQPPMPGKYWDATVRKMKEKFGAAIPVEAIPELVKYLTEAYGAPAKTK